MPSIARTPPRLVLLQGGKHRNKGDELMMLSAHRRIRQLWPTATIGRSVDASTESDRVRLDVEPVLWPRRRNSLAGLIGEPIIGRYAGALGLHRESEVDLVFDVSGWSYGDRWSPGPMRRASDRATTRRRRGVQTVFLPQSLGTFEDPAFAEPLKALVDAATLIFARDEWSLEQVRKVVGDASNVVLGPDYSIDVEAVALVGTERPQPYACIVPNHRVVVEAPAWERTNYLQLLARFVRSAKHRGLGVVQLVHTVGQDDAVAHALDAELGTALPRLTHPDPRVLKGHLGGAAVVVGSRFHSLVSSLSQGIPTIGIGWAPKYPALFKHYDCAEMYLTAAADPTSVDELLNLALDDPGRADLCERLDRHAATTRDEVDEMWRQISASLT